MDCGVDNGPVHVQRRLLEQPRRVHHAASGRQRRRQRHRLRRPARPLQSGDQPAADRPGRRFPHRASTSTSKSNSANRASKTRNCCIRKTVAARRRHPADEESRHHLPGGNDDLDLGRAGPRRLHLGRSSRSAPTNRSPAPTTRNTGADAAHADPAAGRTDARLHLHREEGGQPVQQLPLDVFRDPGTRTRSADQDPGQDRPRPGHRPDQGHLRRPAAVPARPTCS